ncbi:MAG: hypothetical protein KC416_11070 [Myxococcales bacterium]|nr:hypothetical protein [Myxococcales bacterium]
MTIRTAFLLAVGLLLVACGGRSRANPEQTLYTLTNLHPDEGRHQLYSVNYQSEGLIPRCTPVSVLALNRKRAVIQINSSGVKYTYGFHTRSMREDVQTHMNKYFGPECDVNRPAALSQADQAGIRDGQIYEGMSKEGVILAVGYPPEHRTPTLDSDVWVYWRTRMATFEVIFEGGVVKYIRD